MQSVRIDRIKVGTRIRTEMGSIAELAKSIEAYDLMHPIVRNEDNNP